MRRHRPRRPRFTTTEAVARELLAGRDEAVLALQLERDALVHRVAELHDVRARAFGLLRRNVQHFQQLDQLERKTARRPA